MKELILYTEMISFIISNKNYLKSILTVFLLDLSYNNIIIIIIIYLFIYEVITNLYFYNVFRRVIDFNYKIHLKLNINFTSIKIKYLFLRQIIDSTFTNTLRNTRLI